MAFETNYQNNSDIIPEGFYECVIKSVYEDVTKGSKLYINVPLVVRNDIEQKFQNAYIWHSIWKKKEPNQNDLAVGGYTAFGINMLSQAAGLKEGTRFETMEDWMESLKGLPVRVQVEHELNSYTNQMQARVKRLYPTQNPDCKHTWKTAANAVAGTVQTRGGAPSVLVDIPDDGDLPF